MLLIKKITTEGDDLAEVRNLILEYAGELQEDLCFQGFTGEVGEPLKKYGPPHGCLLLAQYNNQIAGCIALQPLAEEGCCEMKRLYVRPAMRKHKIGHALVCALLQEAAALKYATMKLDTLERLQAALALYSSVGLQKPPVIMPIRCPGWCTSRKNYKPLLEAFI
jgi:putative acetyltransferase